MNLSFFSVYMCEDYLKVAAPIRKILFLFARVSFQSVSLSSSQDLMMGLSRNRGESLNITGTPIAIWVLFKITRAFSHEKHHLVNWN